MAPSSYPSSARAPRGWMNKVSSRLAAMRPRRRDALLCPGLVQFWLPSIKEDRRSAEGPRPTAVAGQPFGARPGGHIEALRPLTRAAFLQEAGTNLTTPRAPPEAFVSRTPDVPPASYAASLVAEHSRSAARVLMDKGCGELNGAGKSGNKWCGNSAIFSAFLCRATKVPPLARSFAAEGS
jgi:hypothetical protein